MSDSRPPTELDEVRAELARLRAEVADLRAERAERPTSPLSPPTAPIEAACPIDRRAAIRRAGMLAAGAVAGGAALATVTASPAAAATVTGSGNPGVTATGQGGDGVVATTNTATKAALRATTSTAGAHGAVFVHQGAGLGLSVAGAGSEASGIPAAKVTNTNDGVALEVRSALSYAATFDGLVTIDAADSRPTVAITNSHGGGGGLEVMASGTNALGTGVLVQDAATGLKTADVSTGAAIQATSVGVSVTAGVHHLVLTPMADPAPPARTSQGRQGAIVMHGSDLWLCVTTGFPGTWRRLGGAKAAGALEVLDVPGRAYDSRPATQPAVGPKTKLQPGVARVVDLTAGGTIAVPAGATAAVLTLLLVNASTGNGNLTVWANGVTRPQANTMVWGGDAGRFTATAVSRVDATGKVQVMATLATDIVIDVVGFHR